MAPTPTRSPPRMAPFVDKYGRVHNASTPARRPLLSSNGRTLACIAAVLVVPSLVLKSFRELRSERKVDLSRFSISSKPFDTPAIDKRDGIVRIEFCTS